jgi:hypothetical protein
VLVVLNGCPTGPELSMSFRHPCTIHTFFLERLSNHCQGPRHIFSEFCTTFDARSLFFFRIHREIASGQMHDPKWKERKKERKGKKHTHKSVALVRKRTIPTERPQLVSEVSANFLKVEGAMWSA